MAIYPTLSSCPSCVRITYAQSQSTCAVRVPRRCRPADDPRRPSARAARGGAPAAPRGQPARPLARPSCSAGRRCPVPCAPSLASAGGLPVTGGSIIGSVAAQPAVAAVDTTPGRFDGTSLYGSDVGGSAIAGSIGGAFGGGPFGGGLLGGGGPAGAPDRGSVTGGAPGSSGPAGGALPVSGPGAVGNGTPTPVAPVQSGSPSTPVSGAPEPTAWMLLAVARRPRRPATGAAGED